MTLLIGLIYLALGIWGTFLTKYKLLGTACLIFGVVLVVISSSTAT